MDEKIKSTIDKIKLLAEQNSEFNQAMQKLFGNTVSALPIQLECSVSDDIKSIREALGIKANKSISYEFIKEQRLKDQLYIDNLRMENAAFNLQEKEIDRFYVFCVNAFYQIENIINYYFHTKYPNIDDLLTVLEASTKNDGEGGKYQFKRSKKEPLEKNVGDIQIFFKINALCNLLFPNDKDIKLTLSNLRKVRNEGEHRCQIIFTDKDENNKLYVFLKKATFNSIRIALIKVVSSIKQQVLNPIETKIIEGTIKNKLPSACFVSWENKSDRLPNHLLKKVYHLDTGDSVVLTLSDDKIVDVAVKKI